MAQLFPDESLAAREQGAKAAGQSRENAQSSEGSLDAGDAPAESSARSAGSGLAPSYFNASGDRRVGQIARNERADVIEFIFRRPMTLDVVASQ